MSTHAFIVKQENFKYRGIYIHFDGYIRHTGRHVLRYKTEAEVDQLLALGDIEQIQATIGECKVGDREERAPAALYGSLCEVFEAAKKQWVPYVYVWRFGEWFVKERDEQLKVLKKHKEVEDIDATR